MAFISAVGVSWLMHGKVWAGLHVRSSRSACERRVLGRRRSKLIQVLTCSGLYWACWGVVAGVGTVAAAAAVAVAVGIGAGSGTFGASLRRLLGGSISSCARLGLGLVGERQYKANWTASTGVAVYSNAMEQFVVRGEEGQVRKGGGGVCGCGVGVVDCGGQANCGRGLGKAGADGRGRAAVEKREGGRAEASWAVGEQGEAGSPFRRESGVRHCAALLRPSCP